MRIFSAYIINVGGKNRDLVAQKGFIQGGIAKGAGINGAANQPAAPMGKPPSALQPFVEFTYGQPLHQNGEHHYNIGKSNEQVAVHTARQR